MCLFDQFFCFRLVDVWNMDIKLDREFKPRQRISRSAGVIGGFFVNLTECDTARDLDFTDFFVLLVSHKTNRPGETCGVAGSKQLLGIRGPRFAWSTHFTRYTQI